MKLFTASLARSVHRTFPDGNFPTPPLGTTNLCEYLGIAYLYNELQGTCNSKGYEMRLNVMRNSQNTDIGADYILQRLTL